MRLGWGDVATALVVVAAVVSFAVVGQLLVDASPAPVPVYRHQVRPECLVPNAPKEER